MCQILGYVLEIHRRQSFRASGLSEGETCKQNYSKSYQKYVKHFALSGKVTESFKEVTLNLKAEQEEFTR